MGREGDDGEDEACGGEPDEEFLGGGSNMLLDFSFFKLIDRFKGIAELCGVSNAEIFPSGEAGNFLEGFGVEFLLWVTLAVHLGRPVWG